MQEISEDHGKRQQKEIVENREYERVSARKQKPTALLRERLEHIFIVYKEVPEIPYVRIYIRLICFERQQHRVQIYVKVEHAKVNDGNKQ